MSLYQARASQLTDYGYTAWSLTVIPYVLMSLTNLTANLSCPDYPCLYVVETELLQEARGHGAVVYGTVGQITGFSYSKPGRANLVFRVLLYFIGVCLIACPFLAIGLLTGFRPGPRTQAYEQGWMLSWLISSVIFGVLLGKGEDNTYLHTLKQLWALIKTLGSLKAGPQYGWLGKMVHYSILWVALAVVTVIRILTWVFIFHPDWDVYYSRQADYKLRDLSNGISRLGILSKL